VDLFQVLTASASFVREVQLAGPVVVVENGLWPSVSPAGYIGSARRPNLSLM
jgi:hypothetical protein